jgi:hypothetical protein
VKILRDLLRIKEFREEKAELEVRRVRRALDDAREALDRARDEWAEYQATCQRRERALYEDLFSRLVLLADLDLVSLEVNNMKDGNARYQEEVKSAETVLQSTMESLELAKEAYRLATRMREKFTELVSAAAAEKLVELEYAESMELEEVSGTQARRREGEDMESNSEEFA